MDMDKIIMEFKCNGNIDGEMNLVEWITLGVGFCLEGAREDVLPPSPIFFDILKVDNCCSIYLNYYNHLNSRMISI